MKFRLKSVLAIVLFTIIYCNEQTVISQVHLVEGFETVTLPSLPIGWTKFTGTNGLGASQEWNTSSSLPRTGSKCAYLSFENVTGGLAQDWLVTKQINLSGTGNKLDFYMRQGYASNYGSTYSVRISTTSQTSHAAFTTVRTWSEADFNDSYSFQSVDLSLYDGQNVYIAFVMENDDGDTWRIDDVVVYAPANMAYLSSNVTQPNTTDVNPGTSNQEIVGVEVTTQYSGNPFDLTSMQINMNGSTNPTVDIASFSIYYTGNSSTFNTTTLFGTGLPGAGAILVNGNVQMLEGVNYFWIVYSLTSGATINNFVDAECTQLTFSGITGSVSPTITAPAGKRQIKLVPVTYLMNNTSVNTCSGRFYDSGGSTSNYGNNQNFTKTFCSDNGDHIRFDFTSFNIQNTWDILRVYDGPNTSATLIGTYSSVPAEIFISSGTCLTFVFASDGFTNLSGWSADISCFTPVTCGANPIASDFCATATPINSLSGYCGNTSASYTVDAPGTLAANFCGGSIENNSWLSFVADSVAIELMVFPSNCVANNGVQLSVFETNDCFNFTEIACWDPFYNDAVGVWNSSGYTVGNTYYLMIDGWGGDVCDYMLSASFGVVTPLPIDLISLNSSCLNDYTVINWITATEDNNAQFIIEKSSNGKNFTEVGRVEGNGNSTSPISYSWTDYIVNSSIAYYRIKQVDFDGVYKYYNVISSNCDSDYTIYPNPAKNEVVIKNLRAKGKIANSASIVNVLGDVVLNNIYINAFNGENIIDISSLTNGVYFLIFELDHQLIKHKLIISK